MANIHDALNLSATGENFSEISTQADAERVCYNLRLSCQGFRDITPISSRNGDRSLAETLMSEDRE